MTYNPHMSPPGQHGLMSPPQSVQSQHSLSPPGPLGSIGPHSTSPQKPGQRLLPTSPTHMAAMRNHQRHQSFDFPDPAQQQQQMMMQQQQQNMFTYSNLPTPPQGGQDGNTSYMTPSPESPWSSASPQSADCWSDGIHSPPATFQHGKQQQQQPDGIFI